MRSFMPGSAAMLLCCTGVGELAVNFVGQDQNVVVGADARDFFDFLGGQRGARRVGREIQHERFGARRDRGLDVLGSQ